MIRFDSFPPTTQRSHDHAPAHAAVEVPVVEPQIPPATQEGRTSEHLPMATVPSPQEATRFVENSRAARSRMTAARGARRIAMARTTRKPD